MATATAAHPGSTHDRWGRLLRAGLLTAVTDGLFSSLLNVFAYHSTVSRLWQGVASVLLGARALNGGARTVAVGLAMHVVVAFTWSAVFVLLAMRAAWVRRRLGSWSGVVTIAALYGPLIWMVMSLAVIPLLVHRPPNVNVRWWVQFFGHIPFVGLPIVGSAARRAAAS